VAVTTREARFAIFCSDPSTLAQTRRPHPPRGQKQRNPITSAFGDPGRATVTTTTEISFCVGRGEIVGLYGLVDRPVRVVRSLVHAKTTTGPLNGGNRDTVCVVKWVAADPDVVVLDEPTMGIDVGVRATICELIYDLAQRGKSVVVVSSATEEILLLSHRVIVMRNGHIVGQYDAEHATAEDLMRDALSYDR
jgi:ABC-type sugar transport system ATPase subunit